MKLSCVHRIGVLLLWALVLAPAASAEPKKTTSPEKTAALKTDMIRLFSSLVTVLPLSFDSKRYQDPANEEMIKKSLTEMEKVSHKVSGGKRSIPIDPVSRLVVRGLDSDISDALRLFTEGKKEYSRYIVRDVTGYCIACHTSSPKGRRNFPSNALGEMVAGLTSLEKANFYAATRQYDEAIMQYEYALLDLGSTDATKDSWSLAVKRLMAILIRVRNEPFLALDLVSRIREEKAVPAAMNTASVQWRKSIKLWRDDQLNVKHATAKVLEKARALVQSGEALEAKVGTDAGLVDLLRASRLVNEALSGTKYKGTDYAELLFLGGRISEVTYDINFWTLESLYYEACVRQAPHTSLAGQCFERLRQISVVRGAKAEEFISEQQKRKIDDLAKLAGTVK